MGPPLTTTRAPVNSLPSQSAAWTRVSLSGLFPLVRNQPDLDLDLEFSSRSLHLSFHHEEIPAIFRKVPAGFVTLITFVLKLKSKYVEHKTCLNLFE